MARNQIDTVGPDFHEEVAVCFKRQENGQYRKVLTTSRRDWKTNAVKELGTEPTNEFYEVTQEEDCDASLGYSDFDGNPCTLKLKLIKK